MIKREALHSVRRVFRLYFPAALVVNRQSVEELGPFFRELERSRLSSSVFLLCPEVECIFTEQQ